MKYILNHEGLTFTKLSPLILYQVNISNDLPSTPNKQHTSTRRHSEVIIEEHRVLMNIPDVSVSGSFLSHTCDLLRKATPHCQHSNGTSTWYIPYILIYHIKAGIASGYIALPGYYSTPYYTHTRTVSHTQTHCSLLPHTYQTSEPLYLTDTLPRSLWSSFR